MSRQIILTEQQAKIVQQSLDAAIRAGGANAALVILPIMHTIEKQLATPQPAAAYGEPSVTFEQASAEAVAGVQNPET